jgi:tetratricopeptide (TPR) repeat protein
MAVEEEQQIENPSELPSDDDLFVGKVHRKLTEREVFVGDEDFYRLLADSKPTSSAKRSVQVQHSPRIEPIRNKSISNLQKAFIAAIFVVGAMLLYVVSKPLLQPPQTISTPQAQQMSPPEQPIQESQPPVVEAKQEDLDYQQVVKEQVPQAAPLFSSTEPLSLEVAGELYSQNNYPDAYSAYNQLYQSIPSSSREELLRDLLQFKMAVCLSRGGNEEEAKSLYRVLSKSLSPAITVAVNYNLGLLQIKEKQYLQARNSIYNTIAAINAVDFDKDWIFSLQRDCYFLISELMTRNILALCDADADIPPRLWRDSEDVDPFTSYDVDKLRVLLNSGSEKLKEGLLSPKIKKLEHPGVLSRWSVIAHGPSIEELLSRFAANSELDISWSQNVGEKSETVANAVRKRPVRLYLPSATVQQVAEIAAGHVGLLSRVDDKGLLNISNPAEYSSLSEYISMLVQDTVYLWRNFMFTYPEDKLIPNAHFALGLLYEQQKQTAGAIAEYKLVANQFSQTSLAPLALLNSSKMKTGLSDYPGARADLTQLVEQHPDTEYYGQACMNLAEASRKAGFYSEAGRLYRKVYNLGLSKELQIASAFGAGRCSFEIEDYEDASKWLVRYLNLTKGKPDDNCYLAYYFLGQANLSLEKPKQAIRALQYALNGPVGSLSKERYVKAVSALVETHIKLDNLVEALALLENLDTWQFSKKESLEMLIVKGRVLRLMSLPDKAIVLLADKAESLPASELKTKMYFEVANCYIDRGNLDFAHTILTEMLMSAAPGPLLHEITLRLAEVCLMLDQNKQTVTVCKQLLDSEVSNQIKQKARKVLAAAYHQQKDFDDAALVLAGQR